MKYECFDFMRIPKSVTSLHLEFDEGYKLETFYDQNVIKYVKKLKISCDFMAYRGPLNLFRMVRPLD